MGYGSPLFILGELLKDFEMSQKDFWVSSGIVWNSLLGYLAP